MRKFEALLFVLLALPVACGRGGEAPDPAPTDEAGLSSDPAPGDPPDSVLTVPWVVEGKVTGLGAAEWQIELHSARGLELALWRHDARAEAARESPVVGTWRDEFSTRSHPFYTSFTTTLDLASDGRATLRRSVSRHGPIWRLGERKLPPPRLIGFGRGTWTRTADGMVRVRLRLAPLASLERQGG